MSAAPGGTSLPGAAHVRPDTASLQLMNPAIEAAWIAGGSGLLGVTVGITGTVIVARIGFRSTRDATDATTAAGIASIRAQIEADRRNRIWEKQAAAYTDAIAGIAHRQRIRQGLMRQVLTGTEPSRAPAPVDWTELGARLIAGRPRRLYRSRGPPMTT
jgi:hypothetical protein